MDLDLLLAHEDDGAPFLESGIPERAACDAPKPEDLRMPKNLDDMAGDPNSLEKQRWGVVIPNTPEGERLLSLIKPLQELRQEEQKGRPVEVYRVPPGMTDIETLAWRDQVFEDQEKGQASWPRYLVVLGDLDGVSLEFQQVMTTDRIVGRITFPTDQGYEAYVTKVLKWHNTPYQDDAARALLYTARDGTNATAIGYHALMEPTLSRCKRSVENGLFKAKEILEIGKREEPSRADLFEQLRRAEPAVLFSMSHGLGAPRRGWPSVSKQRELQGAMSLGAGERLTAADAASGAFLPGGVWFFLACYGAGTPKESAYIHWLSELRDAGAFSGRVDSILSCLPKPGDRPFIAALPQAALANPDGPLAVMGHIDLAWTYSFQGAGQSATSKPERFEGIFRALLEGNRAGTAYHTLLRYGTQSAVHLSTLYNRSETAGRGAAKGSAAEAPARAVERASLWMLRYDLLGYVFLGDPAVRLPLSTKGKAPALRPDMQQQLAAYFPGVRVDVSGSAQGAGGEPGAQAMEKAVRAVLREDKTPKAVAQKFGLDKDELMRWVDAYTAAGRAALEELAGKSEKK
jgi:hypothetical protein